MPKPVSKLPHLEVMPESTFEKRTRRRFSAAYKLRIVTAADRCQHGELSALLRREHLYSSQLQQWRRELAENGTAGLNKSFPGPAPSMTPEQVFTGRHLEVAADKQTALNAQYQRHPERFVRGRPRVAMPPDFVAINPIDDDTDGGVASTTVNFPTLPKTRAMKTTLSLN